MFLLNTVSTNFFTLSRTPLPPLNIADTYPLSSTNNKPIHSKINLNATASPCQTFYPPGTAPNTGPSATLLSSSSTVKTKNFSFVITQNYTVPIVAMKKSVNRFDGLACHYTPEKNLYQIDAHMNFAIGEQPPDQ